MDSQDATFLARTLTEFHDVEAARFALPGMSNADKSRVYAVSVKVEGSIVVLTSLADGKRFLDTLYAVENLEESPA